jgi:hypothetical protein
MTPIELRDEEPPDDTIVVVRGGEMKSAAVVRSATDNHDEFGIYAISVFLTLDLPVERLCQVEDGLARYGKVRLSTAGRLRSLGFALLPTLARPHFDVVLPDVEEPTLDRLELAFDQPIPNPGRARQC